MACIVITVSSPYHYAMKARKPPIAEAGACGHQRYGVRKRIAIAHCGAFLLLPPSFPSAQAHPARLAPRSSSSCQHALSSAIASTRMTGRIYRWAYTQKLIATSQATYG